MKFGQLVEYNKRNVFLQRLNPDFFLFFKEALHEIKESGLQLSFNTY